MTMLLLLLLLLLLPLLLPLLLLILTIYYRNSNFLKKLRNLRLAATVRAAQVR